MKKTKFFISGMLAAACLSGAMTSCDDDDDEQKESQKEISSSSVTVIKSVFSDCLDSVVYSDRHAYQNSVTYCDYAYDVKTGNITLVINGLYRFCNSDPKPATVSDSVGTISVSVPDDWGGSGNCFYIYSDTVVLGNLVRDKYQLILNDWNKVKTNTVNIDLTKKQNFENRIYLEYSLIEIPEDLTPN